MKNKTKQKCTFKKAKLPDIASADTGLTALQERAAMLLASGVRISEAAKALDTSRGTIYKWFSLVAFQCYYNLMKQEAKNNVQGSLIELQSQAVEGLKKSMDSDNEAIRLKASVWVLEKIAQMEVGETNVRQALKERSEQSESWGSSERYKKSLEEAGLE